MITGQVTYCQSGIDFQDTLQVDCHERDYVESFIHAKRYPEDIARDSMRHVIGYFLIWHFWDLSFTFDLQSQIHIIVSVDTLSSMIPSIPCRKIWSDLEVYVTTSFRGTIRVDVTPLSKKDVCLRHSQLLIVRSDIQKDLSANTEFIISVRCIWLISNSALIQHPYQHSFIESSKQRTSDAENHASVSNLCSIHDILWKGRRDPCRLMDVTGKSRPHGNASSLSTSSRKAYELTQKQERAIAHVHRQQSQSQADVLMITLPTASHDDIAVRRRMFARCVGSTTCPLDPLLLSSEAITDHLERMNRSMNLTIPWRNTLCRLETRVLTRERSYRSEWKRSSRKLSCRFDTCLRYDLDKKSWDSFCLYGMDCGGKWALHAKCKERRSSKGSPETSQIVLSYRAKNKTSWREVSCRRQ